MLKCATCRLQVRHYLFFQILFPERLTIGRRNVSLLSHNSLLSKNTQNLVNIRSPTEETEAFFGEFWRRHRQRFIIKNNKVAKLIALLECDKDEAERLVEKELELFEENADRTFKKIEVLIIGGISPATILNNLWLLHLAHLRLETYLRAMYLWSLDERHLQEFVLMFDVSSDEFFFISEQFIRDKRTCPLGNRVIYFASKLDRPVFEVLSRMLRKRYLFRRGVKAAEELLDMYLEFGIKSEDILNDFACISPSPKLVRQRLEYLREIGFHPIKPWLARFQYYKLERAVNYFLAEKKAASFKSRENYFAAEMKVDVKLISEIKDHLSRKYPYFLHNIRALTFKNKLKFLLNQGYAAEELICSPTIFYAKIQTIKHRIETLRKLGIERPHITQVLKSGDQFDHMIRMIQTDQNLKRSDDYENPDFVDSSNSEKGP